MSPSKENTAPGKETGEPAPAPLCHEYRHAETGKLVKQVHDLLQEGTDAAAICIIDQKNTYSEQVKGALQAKGILVDCPAPGILEQPFTKKIVLTLQYLAAEHDLPFSGDALLFEWLHADWFGIPPLEIVQLNGEANNRKLSIRQLLYEKATLPAPDLFTPVLPGGLKKAASFLEALLALSPAMDLQQLVKTIIDKSSALLPPQRPDRQEEEQALAGLTSLLALETERNPLLNLPQFVAILRAQRERAVQPGLAKNAVTLLAGAPFKQPAYHHVFRIGGNATLPVMKPQADAFTGPLVKKFVLSATALNTYLRCPLEFYFKHLVRVPSPKNEALGFGSAIHAALERFFRNMQEGRNEQFCSKQAFLADFDWCMQQQRQNFTREQFEHRLTYGKDVLGHYYDNYTGRFHTIVVIERNFRNVMVSGVPVKGKPDKLEFDGKLVKVIDYKTGDPDKAMTRLQPPGGKQPNGGDYWRQAVFYKLLVDNYRQKDWKVTSAEFDFIEPDKMKKYRREKIMISPADTTTVTQQLITSWNKIQNHDFYTGCGKEDCHWCNFAGANNLLVV